MNEACWYMHCVAIVLGTSRGEIKNDMVPVGTVVQACNASMGLSQADHESDESLNFQILSTQGDCGAAMRNGHEIQ